jgi:hypothetical protein
MQEKLLCQLFNELKARFENCSTRAALRSLELGIEALWQDLVDQADDDAYPRAIRRLKSETNNLPTADRVQRILLEETKKARDLAEKTRLDRWYKKKGGETRAELEQQPSSFSRVQQIEMAADAVALLRRIPVMTRLERIIAQQDLEAKYPGSSFGLTQLEIRERLFIREHWQNIEETPPLFRNRYKEELEQAQRDLAEAQTLGLL